MLGGCAPFGYEVITEEGKENKPYLKLNEKEKGIMDYVLELKNKGFGYKRIVRVLKSENIKHPRTNDDFRETTIANLIKNNFDKIS